MAPFLLYRYDPFTAEPMQFCAKFVQSQIKKVGKSGLKLCYMFENSCSF